MRTRAHGGDASGLDLAYLATAFDLQQETLQTVLEAPTPDLVRELLILLTTKGNDFETLKSEKLKADVELETAVRTADAKVKAQKATVAKHAKEVEELRTKLNEAEGARETLSSELEQLRSSSSGSTAETQTLRQRIETLEATNRDTLALVESKSAEKDRIANDLSEQHSKLLTLRKEINQLAERNQSLENAASSQKFKEQSLQQEIDLIKRNNDWHSNELQTRNQEHTKFRKERNARIASLQRELEDSNATVEALKRTETTLRQRLEEVQTKADDAFARIASLQEDATRKEQDLKAEVNSSKRLAELQAQNAATHKARLHEVQSQVDQIKEDAADEIGRLQAEIETERFDKEQAERKVAELELSVERLQQQPRLSRPSTPMRNGGLDSGSRAGSPSALPGSMRKVVGGLSFTQLYTQYTEAQEELVNERRRTDKLSEALDELVNELESRKPELEELRGEQDRLENEVLDYSRLLDESNGNRDNAIREAERWQGEAGAAGREGQILRQQLRDLSAQIKMLLVEIQSRDQGIGELSNEERLELQRAARGEVDENSLSDMTTTGRLISERLVIFRDISELQEQNEKLLRLTRELGEQMEGDEAREKARQSAADAQEIEELRQQVARYKEELQATATQIDSYMKERDMFRRMLQFRGQLAPDSDLQTMFGQSVPPATPSRGGPPPPATPRSRDIEDLNKLLKEQQTFFDQYRNESTTDRRTLKEQADALTREKNALQSDIARAQSKLTLADERYEMLQSNFSALRAENGELQKRSQQMAENAAKQDLRTQQVAEELVEARSMTESLRNENANGKAEKELWKRIETRLTEDNKNLMDERSRLNRLVTDLQNLQNERELAESEGRRRLQSRAESLESELTDTKKKLDVEVEEGRKTALRREYEESQSRTRIDDLVKSLGNVREELVAAKTTRDQLQSRVEELKIELRSAEEKVTALQPRPTPRPDAQTQQTNGEAADLPVEQRLALEVSELRRDLELSRTELESTRQQVEQFRAIAQTTEDELANFTQTADQFKEDADLALAEKDAKITELEQRIEDLSSELTTTNQELSELRAKDDNSNRLLAEQKASFESELVRLRDDAERHAEEKKLYQGDLKAQAEIAQQAQQSYEDELLKHADAAKALQQVRKEYNELRTEIAGVRAEGEAAKVSLERGEESWSEQRDRFERELEESKRRRHDIDEQNKLLHQQMEAFSSELSTLRQNRAVLNGEGTARTDASPAAPGEGNLQEVIKFLRREKEIVDVQYELSIQEAKRLQQQLDYTNQSLEESRQKLLEERRQATDKTNSEGSTQRLAQTINELNLFRESSTTLRNEARQAREKLEEKSKEVERLLAETTPLKGRVGELEGELETKEGEYKLLQDDRDHWRERTQNIISKYDRVDPAEIEEMKKQLTETKTENERLQTEQSSLTEEINGFETRLETEKSEAVQALNERLEKFKGQAKEQDRRRAERIRDLVAEKDALGAELEQVKSQLASTNTELDQTKAALEEARAETSKDDEEEGQVNENQAAAGDHSNRTAELEAEVQLLQGRIQELEGLNGELEQQLADAQSAVGEQGQSSNAPENAETLEKLQQELATAQQEVETLRANGVSTTNKQSALSDEAASDEEAVAQQVSGEVAKLRAELEEQHNLALKQMEEETNRRIENMKNSLRRQLREERDKMRPSIETELATKHSDEIQKLKDEHNVAVERLKQEHQVELEKLTRDGNTAVANADIATEVKAETGAVDGDAVPPELSEAQIRNLIKNNPLVRSLVSNNLRVQVDKQTEKLHATITAKDHEIADLMKAIENTPRSGEPGGNDTISRQELEQQLEAVKKEKETAVRQAIDNAEKKAKVQISQRDMAQAKIAVVRKAATETPDKPVKEVWDIADKTRPAPKPATAAPPATASPKPAASGSTAQAQAQGSPEQIEQEKLRARQERFGTGPALGQTSLPSAPATTSTFGQPSAAPATGSFGQPSAGITAASSTTASDAARPSGLPTAASTGTASSGIPQRGGISRLPSARGGRKPSISGGASIQSAAGQPAQRGGLSSGLPRGGARGRGTGPRGGAANAGQKRSHDGAEGGNEAKRTRGGGPQGGANG